ncbi:MAG: hypothetical protein WCS94_21245, partial [Verrucomicrobiota bacterium]
MKTIIKKLILTGITGALLTPVAHAVTITNLTVGGNASIKIVQDRLTNSVGGVLPGGTITVNSTNSLIFRATGAWNGGSTNVVWDFNFTGGAAAILDIANQNNVTRKDNTVGIPVNAISITAPETVGIDSTPFTQDFTLVAPLVFIKNTNTAINSLGLITNITQRLAVQLESSGGTLPTAYFGGPATSNNIPGDALYFVGRNSSAAVRQVIDAGIFIKASAQNFTTNTSGQVTNYVDSLGNPSGAGSGSEVVSIVRTIPNSIGTVAAQDIPSGWTPLAYEGVPFTTATVTNGFYPLWGYERYIYYPSGSKAPSSAQLGLIKALE